jgi:hypothetical protein
MLQKEPVLARTCLLARDKESTPATQHEDFNHYISFFEQIQRQD